MSHGVVQNSADLSSPSTKQYKTPWYAAVMDNPEAKANLKEYRKQRYEARTQQVKELEAFCIAIIKAQNRYAMCKAIP